MCFVCTDSCRAPGNLQSITVRELINEKVAHAMKWPLIKVQEANFYQRGQTTPFGDVVGSKAFNWTVPFLWKQVKEAVDYESRVEAISLYNSINRFRKRGIAMVPT